MWFRSKKAEADPDAKLLRLLSEYRRERERQVQLIEDVIRREVVGDEDQ